MMYVCGIWAHLILLFGIMCQFNLDGLIPSNQFGLEKLHAYEM